MMNGLIRTSQNKKDKILLLQNRPQRIDEPNG
jgi:hypothetical protein